MPSGWSAKDERMVKHIKDSGEDPKIAFATVNKLRQKQGRTKKSRAAKRKK